MAPFIVEVRNHTRKQVLVVALPSALAPLERLSRFHAKDTPGWDYGIDDIEFVEVAILEPTPSITLFVRGYVRTRKIAGWRVLVAASLRAENTRVRGLKRKKVAAQARLGAKASS